MHYSIRNSAKTDRLVICFRFWLEVIKKKSHITSFFRWYWMSLGSHCCIILLVWRQTDYQFDVNCCPRSSRTSYPCRRPFLCLVLSGKKWRPVSSTRLATCKMLRVGKFANLHSEMYLSISFVSHPSITRRSQHLRGGTKNFLSRPVEVLVSSGNR